MIQQFTIHLQRLGYGKSSVQMLPTCVGEFLQVTAKPLRHITPQDILHYHTYLQQRPHQKQAGGLSERFIAHHLYSLRVFFAWQVESGALTTNPMSSVDLPFPAYDGQTRVVLTPQEVQQLYTACTSLRELAVLGLFYGCGLRRSEAVQLNLADVHFSQHLLYVRAGKNRQRRAVPLSEKVKADLQKYVYHERFAQPKATAFICTQYGNRNSGTGLYNSLKEVIKRSGITKKVTPHSLRHSIATHLLASGLTLLEVRDFLGHQHLESTQIYTHISQTQLNQLA